MVPKVPKVLIAIPSCHALRHFEQAARNTWLREVPAGTDYKFFLGNPAGTAETDEVFLDVGDTLQDLTGKVVAMILWVHDHGYDFVFKADLDTLVRPVALLQSDFFQYDWVGGPNSFFASGGAGYWLSHKAMKAVIDCPFKPGPAEDVNTAHALLAQGITLHGDSRYKFVPGDVLDNSTLTYHLSSVKAWDAKATPEDMYAAYSGTFKLPQVEAQVTTRTTRWLRRR